MKDRINKWIRQTSVKSLAVYLVIATVLSICVTFSKYIVGSSGADGARMIKMGGLVLKETDPNDGKFDIMPNHDLSKVPVVEFTGAEADCYIFMEMTLGTDAGNAWEAYGEDDHFGDPFHFYIYKSDSLTASEKNASNAVISFDVIKDEARDFTSGWNFLKPNPDGTRMKYIYYTEVEANNQLMTGASTGREFLKKLSGSSENTIDVSDKLTLERVKQIKGKLDIKFRAVVMQKKGGSQTAEEAWNSINPSTP